MARLQVKGWSEFQHYKHRSPPWIKLHKSLLDNYDFQCLQLASRALAPMFWLLASESADGGFDADMRALAFRLRTDESTVKNSLIELIEKGFFIDASGALAECKQDALTEKSREEKRKPIVVKSGSTRFPEFWLSYPTFTPGRKGKKPQCETKWRTKKLDLVANEIIAYVEAMKQTKKWQEGFEPAPLTFLNSDDWLSADAQPVDRFAGIK